MKTEAKKNLHHLLIQYQDAMMRGDTDTIMDVAAHVDASEGLKALREDDSRDPTGEVCLAAIEAALGEGGNALLADVARTLLASPLI